MRYRPLLAGAAALALALSLTACGDDGDEESTDTTEAEAESTEDTTAEAEETEDTEAETDDTEAEGEEGATGDLTSLLVTPEAVGEGFVESDYETSTEPGPCGTSIDADYPYDTVVGTVLVEETAQLALQHELRTYADETSAADTFAYAQDALSCGAETSVEGVALGDVTDVSAEIGADAFAVEVTSEADGSEGALVVVLAGPVLSVFQFQGPADVEEGPDPVAIVTENTSALLAEVG